MQHIELYFDGYCPECLLKGQQNEMRLNQDDFYECVSTGLQVTAFPPYAAILRWRGQGKFRESSDVASNTLTGLVMTEASLEDGKEIFPDETKIFATSFDLDWYMGEIYEDKEKYEASKFDTNDPKLEQQRQYLSTIDQSELNNLVEMFHVVRAQVTGDQLMQSKLFQDLHEKLYEVKLIFDFNWPKWHQGWRVLNDGNHDYSKSALLDLSMYLTAIFRADRFNEGTIKHYYTNQSLGKIITGIIKVSDCDQS